MTQLRRWLPAAHALRCPDCRTPAAGRLSRANARLLAGLHNTMLHRGQPVAVVIRDWPLRSRFDNIFSHTRHETA